MQTFDANFFAKNQRKLLRFLNMPFVGREVRSALLIPEDAPIVKITPEAVHAHLGGDKFRATIYSNPQYAQGLHQSFAPLWRSIHAWDMKIANPLQPAWNLGFDTYTSQPDGTAGVDVFLSSANPTTNYNTDSGMEVGESNTATDIRRGLIKFDLSSLATPVANPSSATLSFWSRADRSDNARTFRIYRQKRDWVESQATWNIWKTGNNWQTAGGFGSNDCEQTEIASRAMTASEADGEKQWTNFDLSLLKEMWNGTWTNNGWLIKADTENNDAYIFNSSDYGVAGERPKLVIVYSVMAGTATISGAMTATGTLARYPVFSMGVPRNTFSKNITDF